MQFGEQTWEVSSRAISKDMRADGNQSILKWMVSSGLEDQSLVTTRPSDEVLELLLSSGLMAYP